MLSALRQPVSHFPTVISTLWLPLMYLSIWKNKTPQRLPAKRYVLPSVTFLCGSLHVRMQLSSGKILQATLYT